jgi:hypothetical protein
MTQANLLMLSPLPDSKTLETARVTNQDHVIGKGGIASTTADQNV